MEMLMTWSDVWAVVLTGLIVVFAGLILLIFFVWLFGKIVVGITKARNGGSSDKKPDGTPKTGGSPDKNAATAGNVTKGGAALDSKPTTGISGEVIAAISAAVAAFAGEGAVITSIKRSKRKSRTKSLEWKGSPFGGAEVIESGRWLR
jgi:Na+-transporting methylmalonyl-CoA/oxaloacetate decarboxylase gamma subunit